MTTALEGQGSQLSTRGALRAAYETWRHIKAEYVDQNVPGIVATLASEGPYAMTYSPEVDENGRLFQRVAQTHEAIADYYREKKAMQRTVHFSAYNDLRSDWYTLVHGVVKIFDKVTEEFSDHDLAVLFPIFGRDGITGELSAPREVIHFGEPSGATKEAPGPAGTSKRLANHALFKTVIDAYRAADVDALTATMSEHVQTIVRDYSSDVPVLTEIHGRADARRHFEKLFSSMKVRSVEPVIRLTEDWFIFVEYLWQVEKHGGALEFRTAEIMKLDGDGKIDLHMSHGIDPTPV